MLKLQDTAALWQFPADLIGHLRSEAHQSRQPTYRAMRKAYALSRGRSRKAIRSLFRVVRPAEVKLSAKGEELVASLKRDGMVTVPAYLSPEKLAAIRAFIDRLQPCSVLPVRRDYRPEDLLDSPEIRAVVEDGFIRDLAAAYLGCQPVFTQVAAWWSVAAGDATNEQLSEAAQLYHYDYDWPAFVKFFIYLTDVGLDNGPFTYVLGTHEEKRDWQDGRRDEDYMERYYGDRRCAMTGSAGDLIVADTVGYHKGEPVRGNPRLMLQLEFAVSRLGASFQYPLLSRDKRPAGAGKTFDVFSK